MYDLTEYWFTLSQQKLIIELQNFSCDAIRFLFYGKWKVIIKEDKNPRKVRGWSFHNPIYRRKNSIIINLAQDKFIQPFTAPYISDPDLQVSFPSLSLRFPRLFP